MSSYVRNKLGTGLFDITIEKEGYTTKILRDNRVKLGSTLDLEDIQFLPTPVIGNLDNQETNNIFSPETDVWKPGVTIRIRNTTPPNPMQTKLIFYGANSGNAPVPPNPDIVLFNGQEYIHTVTVEEFTAFINVFNEGPNSGTYEISFL